MEDTKKTDGANVTPDQSIVPPAPAPAAEEKGETVAVPKATFDKLLSTLEKQGKDIEVLREAADKGRLTHVEQMRNKGKLVKNAFLSKMDGKIILGWRAVKDQVYFEDNKLVENQIIEVIFADQSNKQVSLRQFNTLVEKVKGEVIKESKELDGAIYFTLLMEDGEKHEVNIKFIN